MFKQFAIARFMIGFIIFVLTYMVASLSFDTFFHWITAGMFILHLYIMAEVKKGQQEEIAKNNLEWNEKVIDAEERLAQKEFELEQLIQAIIKANPGAHN